MSLFLFAVMCRYTVTAHNIIGTTSYAFTLSVPSCSYGPYLVFTSTKGTEYFKIYDQYDLLLLLAMRIERIILSFKMFLLISVR